MIFILQLSIYSSIKKSIPRRAALLSLGTVPKLGTVLRAAAMYCNLRAVAMYRTMLRQKLWCPYLDASP